MNHYELLQVSPKATIKDLRQAFRTLSKLYHPDTTKLPPIEAAARFQELQHAYTILINSDRRQAYDAELVSHRLRRPMQTITSSRIEFNLNRRPLSGGELFAILLLCFSMVCCLILGLGLVWIQGKELRQVPIWLEQSYNVKNEPSNMPL